MTCGPVLLQAYGAVNNVNIAVRIETRVWAGMLAVRTRSLFGSATRFALTSHRTASSDVQRPTASAPCTDESGPRGRDHSVSGLAPRDARVWLRLHRAFAWNPEIVTPRLLEGAAPEEILASMAPYAARGADMAVGKLGGRDLDADLACLEALGVRVVPRLDPGYPERLGALLDAPSVLLVRGDVSSLDTFGVAIVGARAATQSSRQTARRLGRELASCGVTIISGLARGIDAAAHRGALDAGGRTIGVLACGPDRTYPAEHRGLAREICERGAIVSEMPVGAPPRRAHFPLRNRLISGLSVAVIVVEARRRSGWLITVRHALNQGREVFVVPGSVEGPFAEGTNQLLREGARPIRNARDVFEDLGLDAFGSGAPDVARPSSGFDTVTAAGSNSDSPVGRVLSLLKQGPLSRDALSERLELEPGSLAQALLELELANRVVQDRDGRLQLNWA